MCVFLRNKASMAIYSSRKVDCNISKTKYSPLKNDKDNDRLRIMTVVAIVAAVVIRITTIRMKVKKEVRFQRSHFQEYRTSETPLTKQYSEAGNISDLVIPAASDSLRDTTDNENRKDSQSCIITPNIRAHD